jgi:3-hydroxybutyryl-CoA dehydrogenase
VAENTVKVAIVGAGWMGAQLAVVYAAAGCQVRLMDQDASALERSMSRIRQTLAEERPDDAQAAFVRITPTLRLEEAVRGVQIVQECVPESLNLKQTVFAQAEEFVDPQTVLGTNTSSLSVTEIANGCRYRDRVIGVHWISPAYLIPVVEVIRGQDTSDAVVETVRDILRLCDRTPIVCQKELPGFIFNRLQHVLLNEALFLVSEGYVSREDVDDIVRWGMAPRLALWGPMRLNDLVVNKKTTQAAGNYIYRTTGDARFRPARLLDQAVQQGRLGIDDGAGFYDYDLGEKPQILRDRDSRLKRILSFLRDLA